ncbi:MAG: DUF1097 domain-containing protein, partial [Actinomycetes bacterium]
MRNRVPAEVVASILAASTAFIGGTALHLPTWAIFISWAGIFLLGGPTLDRAKKMWIAMPAGSTFGLVIVLLEQNFGTMFGDSQIAKNAAGAIFIFAVNCILMYCGRIPLLSLVPGMFLGFASFFGTYFGDFGFAPGNVFAAWVSVVAMNALGPVFGYLKIRYSNAWEAQSPPLK